MTKEKAIQELIFNKEDDTCLISVEALDLAIKALEIVEEFEKAQIITGGRLNGRTYAYKCGLEDGKRKALEQQPTQSWIPLVWDEYPTVDMDGNDDYVYAVDYSVPMPKEDEWVLITDENYNVRTVQYDGYDFGDYVREEILAWAHSPMPYKD